MFTNVPTVETIDLIVESAFKVNNTTYHDLTKKQLRDLFRMCNPESHFQFGGVYYDQIDGVAMGSPLGPLFANVFVSDFERKQMETLISLGVRIWFRNVDDIFASLISREQATIVLQFLNVQFEEEFDDKLPFLDTLVVCSSDLYTTIMYRKKTFTGFYLN